VSPTVAAAIQTWGSLIWAGSARNAAQLIRARGGAASTAQVVVWRRYLPRPDVPRRFEPRGPKPRWQPGEEDSLRAALGPGGEGLESWCRAYGREETAALLRLGLGW
jgi:hypothetical protein